MGVEDNNNSKSNGENDPFGFRKIFGDAESNTEKFKSGIDPELNYYSPEEQAAMKEEFEHGLSPENDKLASDSANEYEINSGTIYDTVDTPDPELNYYSPKEQAPAKENLAEDSDPEKLSSKEFDKFRDEGIYTFIKMYKGIEFEPLDPSEPIDERQKIETKRKDLRADNIQEYLNMGKEKFVRSILEDKELTHCLESLNENCEYRVNVFRRQINTMSSAEGTESLLDTIGKIGLKKRGSNPGLAKYFSRGERSLDSFAVQEGLLEFINNLKRCAGELYDSLDPKRKERQELGRKINSAIKSLSSSESNGLQNTPEADTTQR